MFNEFETVSGVQDAATPDAVVATVSEQPAEKPAKPAKLNKSQAIRDYDIANPGKASLDVVAGLAAQGVEVTKALVDNTRWYDKKQAGKQGSKKSTKKAAKKAVVKKATPTALVGRPAARELTVAELQRFKTVIDEMGGIIVAKIALAYLERFSR